MTKHFEHLFVFGRPAGGKSEFIDYMKKCNPEKRLGLFHIAPFDIIDDYEFLKEIAEHETILEKFSIPRLLTKLTNDGIVANDSRFFEFAGEKINLVVPRNYLSKPEFYDNHTLLIEGSRGVDKSGYTYSLNNLKPEILKRSTAIYIKVSHEESLKRNEARYQEKLKYSMLAHKCPVEAMERFYREDDWGRLTDNRESGTINISGVNLPFVIMNNEPESKDLNIMEGRYKAVLDKLFDIWKSC